MVVCAISLAIILFVELARAQQPINIVFIMADDYGWNDVSWNNPKMPTPVLEGLALGEYGVLLENAYVNYLCSPTRSAFLTGYYPHHIGTQGGTFTTLEPNGVPLDFTFLPETLTGYKSYMVGKWHLGYCNEAYTPLNRGFDRFYGFYNGAGNHYSHKLRPMTGEKLALDLTDMTNADFSQEGNYSTEMFKNKALEYIAEHKASNGDTPFFLYYSMQAVHTPLEVPSEYLESCTAFTDETRRLYCGMVKAMDHSIGQLVDGLDDLGYYDNTIFIFSADNGGQHGEGSNNYPLRGNKGTLWEGATKAVSFIHAKNYVTVKGKRDELFHIVDWYPTIMSFAGIDNSSFNGDGINQEDLLLRDTQTTIRDSFVYNIDRKGGDRLTSGGSAIRIGDYKLIAGSAGGDGTWNPDDYCDPCEETPSVDDSDRKLWLFNIAVDPYEENDLSENDAYRSKFREMKLALAALQGDEVESIHTTCSDPRGLPANFNPEAFSTGWCEVDGELKGHTPLFQYQIDYLNDEGNIIDGNSKSPNCQVTLVDGNKVCNCGDGSYTTDIEPEYTVQELIDKAVTSYEAGECTLGSRLGEVSDSNSGAGKCGSGTSRVKSIYAKVDKTTYWLIVSNGIPDHCHDMNADSTNPNVACEHYSALIVPKEANDVANINFEAGYSMMGHAGIATSGAFIYNDASAESCCNAAAITEKATFDVCDGHSSGAGQYHYHKMPYPSNFCIPGGYESCKLLGYMVDGVPIYSPCTFMDNTKTKSCYKLLDKLAADTEEYYGCETGDYEYVAGYQGCTLDEANGMLFSQDTYSDTNVLFKADTYAYFYSEGFPYVPPKYYGYGNSYWCEF